LSPLFILHLITRILGGTLDLSSRRCSVVGVDRILRVWLQHWLYQYAWYATEFAKNWLTFFIL